MRKIDKDETPEFWSAFIRKNPKMRYCELDHTDSGREVRRKIHNHMILDQRYLCCYCCKEIELEKSHNEHICPESKFPNKTMEYENLLVSCTSQTCGMAKKDKYDAQLFVSPLYESCASHFKFCVNGEIVGTTKEGKYTITCLNLNEYSLRQARKSLYDECCRMAKLFGAKYIRSQYIQEKEGKLPRFVDMVTYFYDHGFFDEEIVAFS